MRKILVSPNINTRSRGGYPCELLPWVNATATLYRTAHILIFSSVRVRGLNFTCSLVHDFIYARNGEWPSVAFEVFKPPHGLVVKWNHRDPDRYPGPRLMILNREFKSLLVPLG